MDDATFVEEFLTMESQNHKSLVPVWGSNGIKLSTLVSYKLLRKILSGLYISGTKSNHC